MFFGLYRQQLSSERISKIFHWKGYIAFGGNCEREAGSLQADAWVGEVVAAAARPAETGTGGEGSNQHKKGPLGRACHRGILCSFLLYLSLYSFNKNMAAHWGVCSILLKQTKYNWKDVREFLICRFKAEWNTYIANHWNLFMVPSISFAILPPFLIYDHQHCLQIIFITVLCYHSSFIPSMFFLFLQIVISLVWIFNWNQNWMWGSHFY